MLLVLENFLSEWTTEVECLDNRITVACVTELKLKEVFDNRITEEVIIRRYCNLNELSREQ